MSLSVSGIVRVTVNLTPQAAAARSFGVLLVAGDSNVINGLERIRTYLTIEGVAADFGVNAPEYKAAALYFGQSPKPRTLMIGRWLRTASAGANIGGILSASDQLISKWTAISSGGFVIPVDGVTKTLSALDFTGVTNLNGVASVINASLTGGSIAWNGTNFVVTSNTTGAGGTATGTIVLDTNTSPGVRATNTIQLTGQPAAANTVTIQGTVVTFVSGAPGANQVAIGIDVATTLANLLAFLQNSPDANLALFTYGQTASDTLTATARQYGTTPNAYTLTKVGANIVVGAATFAGGVAADTLTVNGTAFVFLASGSSPNGILVGATATATSANIQTKLAASIDANVSQATYATVGTTTTVTFKTPGTAGNAFTLAKSSSHITLSGAVLAGGTTPSSVGYATAGSGTDISALLKLTAVTNQALVTGYNAESPVEAAAVFANKSAGWYGLMFQASTQPTDDQNILVADFVEALDLKRMFGVTIVDPNVLSALVTNDLASRFMAGAYRQTFSQYSSTNVAAVASFYGRGFTVDFSKGNTTITLKFKQEPGVVGEDLTENQALVLTQKRCNVFVKYVNDTVILQQGVMAGPVWWDETHGLDWLQNEVQTAVYNVLYTSPKVAQTDAGVNQLVNAMEAVYGQAVVNGLVAPGIWNADGFGELKTGDYLKTGYYIFAQAIALQSQASREAREAPPIQSAVKLAGAIQISDILIDVNR